jgi:hypothetical protein
MTKLPIKNHNDWSGFSREFFVGCGRDPEVCGAVASALLWDKNKKMSGY